MIWIAILWLAGLAVFLCLVERAPLIDDDQPAPEPEPDHDRTARHKERLMPGRVISSSETEAKEIADG